MHELMPDLPATLPSFAYAANTRTDGLTRRFASIPTEVFCIHRGDTAPRPVYTDKSADELNAACGVTVPQREAMLFGILFGWMGPGVDPSRYDDAGRQRAVVAFAGVATSA